MLAAPATATIEPALRDRINVLLADMVEFLDEESFEIRSLVRDADRLANASGAASSIIKAEIYQLTGSEEKVRYWLDNARKLGSTVEADHSGSIVLSNLGYFSEAAQLYAKATTHLAAIPNAFPVGMIVAAFDAMVKASELAALAHLEVDMEPYLSTAKKAHAVLSRIGVDESAVQSILDIAGEVLRRHSLMWADQRPVIRMLNDAEDAALLYQLFVPVSADRACALTDEVLTLMAERDVGTPGVAFGFLAARP